MKKSAYFAGVVLIGYLMLNQTGMSAPVGSAPPELPTMAPLVAVAAELKETVVAIQSDAQTSPRVQFGIGKLREALSAAGYQAKVVEGGDLSGDRPLVVVGTKSSILMSTLGKLGLGPEGVPAKPQGFALKSLEGGVTAVAGVDDSGTLYGLLELADRIKAGRKLASDLNVTDAPAMLMRGPCIGMQKSQWIYEGAMYDFSYTPANFPFFYDKEQWRKYLDFMVENRMNMLTLWNGHPFTSLLKLPKFPDAKELDTETLNRNIEIFTWLTHEADRRGIYVVQFFYNIHLSHALVKSRQIQTGSSRWRFACTKPTPLTSEYTRYCISEFIRNYPNVGLMMCLGEALDDNYDAEWLTETIIPGVKDGMQAIGLKEEPPIIVRAHATRPAEVVTAALKIYRNIFTMAKFNDESLITWHPTGPFRQKHMDLINLGSLHIMNVHLVANLEPFRYGSPVFIRKSVKAMCDMGARGLHVYPLSYWGWPDSPDKTTPRLHQLDRDWLWFAAWARYGWSPERPEREERDYWTGRLAEKYGNREAGEKILDAYVASGECLTRMHGRFSPGSGGFPIFTLGMTLPQLMYPELYAAYTDPSSCRLEGGESLQTYASQEWYKQPHAGETPPLAIEYALTNARQAVEAIESAGTRVTRNNEEFDRLRTDMKCILTLMECYAAKIEAGLLVLRYGFSHDVADLKRALPLLEKSLDEYRKLTSLTEKTYLYANSLQENCRTVPFSCEGGKNTHWLECLPHYERELQNFKSHLALIKPKSEEAAQREIKPLPAVPFNLLTGGAETYDVREGAKIYTDRDYTIGEIAEELRGGLKGIRFSNTVAKEQAMSIEFELPEPAKILVGIFDGESKSWAKVPSEGGWDLILHASIMIGGLNDKVNLYGHNYPVGRQKLDLGKGTFLVFGFTKPEATVNRQTTPFHRKQAKELIGLFE